MLRVSGGTLCGRRLISPAQGQQIRPTTERVREAIFSMLLDSLPGAQVLDLFAGTGTLGIEALSRGAQRVLFVEQQPLARRLIQTNLRQCGLQQQARLLADSAVAATSYARLHAMVVDWGPFDVVFMDPPWQYDQELIGAALMLLAATELLREGAWVIAEHESPTVEVATPPWSLVKQRRYGRTYITIWSWSP
ncbi:MAG: 16S rRNA (guanine(966)-N(2))-methyltransferase RsmD [Magnetococcales bacterium]|nr:16S rRNA (guanine(966)-N(2))-methyltransferase RsmD [Magnetococcales bacterium]